MLFKQIKLNQPVMLVHNCIRRMVGYQDNSIILILILILFISHKLTPKWRETHR